MTSSQALEVSDSEKIALKSYCDHHLSLVEEKKLLVTYKMLQRITGTCDEQELDILQRVTPIFCFTAPGIKNMALVYVEWRRINGIKDRARELTTLRKNIFKFCEQVELLRLEVDKVVDRQ
jgi:hypothetical protein